MSSSPFIPDKFERLFVSYSHACYTSESTVDIKCSTVYLYPFLNIKLRVWALLLHAGALMPGAFVAAKVEKVLSDGLSLSFLSFFSGTVDQFHLAEVTCSA